VRGDLARAIVEAGWDLNELLTSAVSLEEVFLQLNRRAGCSRTRREASPSKENFAMTNGGYFRKELAVISLRRSLMR